MCGEWTNLIFPIAAGAIRRADIANYLGSVSTGYQIGFERNKRGEENI